MNPTTDMTSPTPNVPHGGIVLAALYHFADFPDYAEKREAFKAKMLELDIKGTILLASEGINGTVSGTPDAVRQLLDFIREDARFSGLEVKESIYDRHPFQRTKVKLKKELISLGEDADPSKIVGTYVNPQDWNALLADPEVTLLDSRNTYETHIGMFKGAIDPRTDNFKQLPAFVRANLDPKKNKKIATFCTGGIRCEKLTSWLKAEGFEEVYHLKGGILKYLEEIPAEESLWEGECYVFDERVGVGHGLEANRELSMCPACGHALKPEDRQHEDYVAETCCAFCPDDKKQ